MAGGPDALGEGGDVFDACEFGIDNVGDGLFEGTYLVGEAGPYGVTVRAIPQHADLINPMELGLVAWAT